MKTKVKGRSIYSKLFAAFFIISALVFLDYYSFLTRTHLITLHDELESNLSTIRNSITKLEYTLDMFIVARRFEDTTVSLIKRDVERLDVSVRSAVYNPRYKGLAESNALLKEGFESMAEDWQNIKNEIGTLRTAMSQEEVLLIHNAVDVHTILVSEMAERLRGLVSGGRNDILANLHSQVLRTIVGFLLVCAVGFYIFYRRIVLPMRLVSETAEEVSSGDLGTRFPQSRRGYVSQFAEKLNMMLDAIGELSAGKDKEAVRLHGKLNDKTVQIEALGLFTAVSGGSLSKMDIFTSGVREIVHRGGADAACIYIHEDGKMKLKYQEGFDSNFVESCSTIRSTEHLVAGPGPVLYETLDKCPDEGVREALSTTDFSSLLCVPVIYECNTIGMVLAAFKGSYERSPATDPFFTTVATIIGVFAGYVELFHNEYSVKRFFERVVNQLPFGVAVFDKDGTCLMLNSILKGYFGADPKEKLVGDYRITEDEVLSSQGMTQSIQKAYEGYVTEFIINYDPSHIIRYKFTGRPRKLKIKAIPFYDQGGEITNILLLYEDLSDSSDVEASTGEVV